MTETLQSICVKTIALNFNKFCKLFESELITSPVATIYSKSLKLIKKYHSEQIIRILADGNGLRNNYLQILLNEYTRQVILHHLISCDYRAIEQRFQTIGSAITKFSISGQRKFYNCDDLLKHLTNIEILEMKMSFCTDRTLQIVSENCTQLQSLDASGCSKITDRGLRYLCLKNPPLESLNVELTSVTYMGVAEALNLLPKLTKLWFNNVPRAIMEACGYTDITTDSHKVFNLTNLVVLSNRMRPENHLIMMLRNCSTLCPHVTDLVVGGIVTEEQLECCTSFCNLEAVNLQSDHIDEPKLSINPFIEARGHKLSVLSIVSFSFSVDTLAECCPNLECLTLHDTAFQEMQKTEVLFPKLKILRMQSVDIEGEESTKSVISILSSSPNLQQLGMVRSSFSEEIKSAIMFLPKSLFFLDFTETVIDVEFVEQVLRVHTCLSKLVITNTGITLREYDDIMDLVDEIGDKVSIEWADYSEAIRELFVDSSSNRVDKPFVIKL